ncbi:MAG: helix-turn-helix domain-containing protein [archaeon]
MNLDRFLDTLKLTLYEKEIIAYLATVDSADANTIYKNAKVPQGRIYSVLQELHKKGFVDILPVCPKKYQIRDIKTSLKQYLKQKEADLQEKRELIDDLELAPRKFIMAPNDPSVSLFLGRDEHLQIVASLRDAAQDELLQIAPSFRGSFASRLAMQKALKRRVKVKVITLGVNPDNKPMIKTTVENGGEVRILEFPRTAFMIKDSEEFIIVVHNYEKMEERTVILCRNKALLDILKDKFFEYWQKAKPVKKEDLE